ncbi:TPA: hypothetical protein ACTZ5W_005932 [Bacillus cereus]
MAQGRATVTVRIVARTPARHRIWQWQGTRYEEQTNETTMKEQRKKNERRTTKTNDNSKIR